MTFETERLILRPFSYKVNRNINIEEKMSKKCNKLIADIRIYYSDVENVDGNPYPKEFASKKVNIAINRIVMKLRECGFTLGDFDHLYVNFTPCVENGQIFPAKRSIDTYHKWYRYFDIGLSKEQYQMLTDESSFGFIVDQIKNTLNAYFNFDGNCSVELCIDEAINKGEDMLVLYKTKQTATRKADIYLQLSDSGTYCPKLFVYDQSGTEMLCEKLPATMDLMSLGEIQINAKRVIIKPCKNSLLADMQPIFFEF